MFKKRYRRILFFFAGVVLQIAFMDIFLSKIGLRKISEKGRDARILDSARRYRHLAVEMGGVLIKVGQFLSARVDMLPAEVTEELSGLQDQVPEENFESIRKLAEEELRQTLEESFEEFEEIPLASASLGQVHRAVLRSEDALEVEGSEAITEVVVKVQRPDNEAIINVDSDINQLENGSICLP